MLDILDGDQAIDTILAQPACATFMARKLWTFFAYENPPAPLVAALANTLRANNYEVRPLLHQMFTSQEFYSPAAVRTQIKSPVQWMVQTVRTMEIELPPKGPLAVALRQMGQVPFYPPNVKGWDGGKAWISTSTLLTRYNLAGSLLNHAPARGAGRPPGINPAVAMAGAETLDAKGNPVAAHPLPTLPPGQVDLHKLAPPEIRNDPALLVRTLGTRLFQGPIAPKDEQSFTEYVDVVSTGGGAITDQHVTGLLHLMMSTPSFQLC